MLSGQNAAGNGADDWKRCEEDVVVSGTVLQLTAKITIDAVSIQIADPATGEVAEGTETLGIVIVMAALVDYVDCGHLRLQSSIHEADLVQST